MVAGLNAIPGIQCPVPQGAFYTFASCEGLLGATTPGGRTIRTDRDVADYLLKADVAVVPGACFGLEPFFRISYATSEDELRTALERIGAACEGLKHA